MSYICWRLGSQSVSQLFPLFTDRKKKKKKKKNLRLLEHTGVALPWQRKRWGSQGKAEVRGEPSPSGPTWHLAKIKDRELNLLFMTYYWLI